MRCLVARYWRPHVEETSISTWSNNALEWLRRRPEAEEPASFVWHGHRKNRPRVAWGLLLPAALLASGFYLGRLSSAPEPGQNVGSKPESAKVAVSKADTQIAGNDAPDAKILGRPMAPPAQPQMPPVSILNAGAAEQSRSADQMAAAPDQGADSSGTPAQSRISPRPPAGDRGNHPSSKNDRGTQAGKREVSRRVPSQKALAHPYRNYDDLRDYMLKHQ